jgi:hypothetical protein
MCIHVTNLTPPGSDNTTYRGTYPETLLIDEDGRIQVTDFRQGWHVSPRYFAVKTHSIYEEIIFFMLRYAFGSRKPLRKQHTHLYTQYVHM